MRTIGASEARNTFGTLLDLVEKGEQVVITRYGKTVARLISDTGQFDLEASRQAAARIRERAKGVRLGGLSIKDLTNEGRP